MAKSSGHKKLKTAVFISGTGSNLKNLIVHSKKKNSKFIIDLIISNNLGARGLNYAKQFNINKKIINFSNPKKAEKIVLNELKKKKIELVCLAGFMKILSKNFIKKFKGKILNIHPSLLPKYKGLNIHKRVLKNKEKFSGCTVHYVNSKLDSGEIILQKKVKVSKNETENSLIRKILIQEHKLYPKAVLKVFNL